MVDAWWPVDLGDLEHERECSHQVPEETAGSSTRFDLSTQRATVRRRIPLSSDRPAGALSSDADPPDGDGELAEGSSPDLFGGTAIPVEVRLRRRNLAPSPAQVDDVVAWLRTHRIPRAVASGTPPPALAPVPEAPAEPPQLLQPLVEVEAARGPLWPLMAVSLGLATALLAAIIL